jgi:predicted fused transcriptional regulator/phosphomethylpyrimidine kinase
MEHDRYHVMGQMVEAVALLASSERMHTLLPEIRSNLVMALEDAAGPEDIAGIPGRLTAVAGRITAPAYPAWGASRYTALILLEVRKLEPGVRSAMEIRYAPDLVERIKGLGMSIARLDIREGDSLGAILGRTMTGGKLPDLFFTEGGFAREGAIVITGRDAVEVAGMAVKIAQA